MRGKPLGELLERVPPANVLVMFSSAHWLGPNVSYWFPHVMVWAPGLASTDLVPTEIGSFGLHSGLPIMDGRYGPRQPLIAIPVGKAIEPIFATTRR